MAPSWMTISNSLLPRAGEAQQVANQNEMTGRGHRQELGQTLHQAQKSSLQGQCQIHGKTTLLQMRKKPQDAERTARASCHGS